MKATLTGGTIAEQLQYRAPGSKVVVMTDGGIYQITDICVSQVRNEIILVGER